MENFSNWLIDNKVWIGLLSGTIAFISGTFGIFYKDTVKKDEKTKKQILTKWGLFTLITLIISTAIQGLLSFVDKTESRIANEVQQREKEKEDSILRIRFKIQIEKLESLNIDLNNFKDNSLINDSLNNLNFDQSLKKMKSLNRELIGLNQKNKIIIDSTISLSTKVNSNVNEVKRFSNNFHRSLITQSVIKEYEINKKFYENLLDSLSTVTYNYFETFGAEEFIRKDQRGILHLKNEERLGVVNFDKLGKLKYDADFLENKYGKVFTNLFKSIEDLSKSEFKKVQQRDKFEKELKILLFEIFRNYNKEVMSLLKSITFYDNKIQEWNFKEWSRK